MQLQQQALLKFLLAEGFPAAFDAEGDIPFKCEGWTYVLCFDEKDPDFAKLILPGVWDVAESDCAQDVLEGLDQVNRTIKVVKGYTHHGKVSFAVEIWCDDPVAWTRYLQRALRALAFARSTFGAYVSACQPNDLGMPVDAVLQ